jgi:hypothetical protein
MCQDRYSEIATVKIPADLSCTGQARWREIPIDACIAPIVRALQAAGIDMRGSCCGHGKTTGHIDLQDGRGLIVLSPEQNERHLSGVPSGAAEVQGG